MAAKSKPQIVEPEFASGLDAYNLPVEVTDGVWIALRRAPNVRFLIKLPMPENRRHQLAMMSGLKVDPNGAVISDVSEIDETRRKAFRDTCIVKAEIDGSETDWKPIAAKHPLVLTELFDRAHEMANKAAEAAAEAEKKFTLSLAGDASGEDEPET